MKETKDAKERRWLACRRKPKSAAVALGTYLSHSEAVVKSVISNTSDSGCEKREGKKDNQKAEVGERPRSTQPGERKGGDGAQALVTSLSAAILSRHRSGRQRSLAKRIVGTRDTTKGGAAVAGHHPLEGGAQARRGRFFPSLL